MTTKGSTLAALRIAALREEFSEGDLHAAVELLERHGHVSSLLDYLAGRTIGPAPAKRTGLGSETIDSELAKLNSRYRGVDQERFDALEALRDMVRSGSVLRDADEVRQVGQLLDKSFGRQKGRREALQKLFRLLGVAPKDDIRRALSHLQSAADGTPDSAYQKLANFLISGRPVPAGR